MKINAKVFAQAIEDALIVAPSKAFVTEEDYILLRPDGDASVLSLNCSSGKSDVRVRFDGTHKQISFNGLIAQRMLASIGNQEVEIVPMKNGEGIKVEHKSGSVSVEGTDPSCLTVPQIFPQGNSCDATEILNVLLDAHPFTSKGAYLPQLEGIRLDKDMAWATDKQIGIAIELNKPFSLWISNEAIMRLQTFLMTGDSFLMETTANAMLLRNEHMGIWLPRSEESPLTRERIDEVFNDARDEYFSINYDELTEALRRCELMLKSDGVSASRNVTVTIAADTIEIVAETTFSSNMMREVIPLSEMTLNRYTANVPIKNLLRALLPHKGKALRLGMSVEQKIPILFKSNGVATFVARHLKQ